MDRGTDNTLPKRARLSGKSSISTLLAKGRWGSCGCLRFCCLSPTGEDIDRIMVSVPKKHFKRAVKRNLLKRRIRESYRTQKQLLTLEGGTDILFIYNSKEVLDSVRVKALVAEVLTQISSWKSQA